ncbi:Outer membrane protein [Treponema sp. JC4]|uniref:OmpA family protein n=1 Tax=Treponema sp. JC4 TaxID=1124982 RepID=UPI00025B0CA1|nr:OmpA family protein [Treponema sp. JC4]EID84395.1 Outer membrane protein [Treponema sp. JC4]
MILKKYLIIGFLLSITVAGWAQSQISYNGSPTYTLVERTDLLRYDNNKYVGLMSREVRSFITPVSQNNGYLYEGNFFVNEKTQRNTSAVASGIHDSILSVFRIGKDGVLTMVEDHGYPSFRSFPSYPGHKIQIGERWQAKAERAVDPLNKGIVTKMPIYVEYTYAGDETLNEEPVYRINAQWATRYGMGSGTSYIDWGGDRELQKAMGTHKASILVSKASGAALVVRDSVDETFVYADGNQIHLKGTINLFTEYPPSVNRDRLLPALRRFAMIDEEEEEKLRAVPEKALAVVVEEKEVPGTDNDIAEERIEIAMADLADTHENLAEAYEEVLEPETKRDLTTAFQPDELPELPKKNAAAITVDQTPAGLRLTIQDLQFEADSAKLLPGEQKRLDNIAAVLKEAGQSQFLIEGHTARVGSTEGEMELSLSRAHAIAEELAKCGIQAGRFICKGSGGNKPVADNSTAEGRARNRRVEITILE